MKKRPVNHVAFEENMLPKNRKEVYKDVFKLHFKKLLLLSFLLFLFSIPLQLSAYLKEMTTTSIYQTFAEGSISLDEATTALTTMSNQFALINVVTLLIFGIGLSGVIRIIKRLSWYEPIAFFHDFSKGVKDNGIQYSITFLGIGLLSFVTNLIVNLSSLVEESIVYEYLGLIPKVVFIILLTPVVAYLLVVIAIYTNRFRNQFRLSLFLFVSSIVKTIKYLFLLSLPFLILLIPNFYVHLIGRVLLVLIIPFILLKWFLLASDILDLHWNAKHYPELVNRGVLGIADNKSLKE